VNAVIKQILINITINMYNHFIRCKVISLIIILYYRMIFLGFLHMSNVYLSLLYSFKERMIDTDY
jgi:hypothetical protein